jgi:hypothetical protein
LVSNFYIIVSGGGEVYATYVPALSGELLKMLVGGITLHRGGERKTTVAITYRFGLPDDRSEVEAGAVSNKRNPRSYPKSAVSSSQASYPRDVWRVGAPVVR